MDRDGIVQALRPLAARTHGLELLLLVGSRARGQAHPASDVDLAVLVDPVFDLAGFTAEVTMALGRDDVDVADLARANALFRFEAAAHGILIHGDPDAHFAFRLQAVHFWCDAGPLIRQAYDHTLARLG